MTPHGRDCGRATCNHHRDEIADVHPVARRERQDHRADVRAPRHEQAHSSRGHPHQSVAPELAQYAAPTPNRMVSGSIRHLAHL